MHVVLLVVGMILLVFGAQGGIRLLVDHDNAGLLGWVPGGFPMQLACFAALTLLGLVLAGRGGAKVRQPGS